MSLTARTWSRPYRSGWNDLMDSRRHEVLVQDQEGSGVHVALRPASAIPNTQSHPDPDGQIPLFHYTPPEVVGMHATKDSRHLVGTALGIAVNLSHEQFGMTPHADTNLSDHSLRAVQRMGKAVPNHHEFENQESGANDQDFTSSQSAIEDAEYEVSAVPHEVLSPEKVAAGRETIRAALRGRR